MSIIFVHKEYTSSVVKGLAELRDDNSLCDGTLQTCDEETFRVHRCVLAASSPYFRAMFTGGFREANDEQLERPIVLPTITSEGLRHVLDYMYSGRLILSKDTVYDVLIVAHMLQLTDVLSSCTEILISELSLENCFQTLEVAEKYEMKQLKHTSETFILNSFVRLSETTDYKELSISDLCKYLESDKLKGNEIDIFRTAMAWFDCKPDRDQYLKDIMKLVNFKAIPADVLADVVLKNESIECNEDCLEIVMDAVKYQSDTFSKPFNGPDFMRGEESVIVIASYTGEESSVLGVDMDTYKKSDVFGMTVDQALDCKIKSLNCRLELGSLSLVNLNNFLFLFGTDSGSFASVAKRFDVMTGDWLDLASLPRPGTIGSTAAKAENSIIVVGGMLITKDANYDELDSSKFVSTTLQYSVACNDWRTVQSCPVPLVYHSSCSHQDRVYVAGGYISSQNPEGTIQVSAKLYVYDLKEDTWTSKANLNEARCEAVFEAIDSKLFLLGGGVLHSTRYAVPSVEMYDTEVNQWTTVIESDPSTLMHAAASFIDGKNVIIVGGYNMETKDTSDHIVVFDTESRGITTLNPRLEYSLCRHVCATMKIPV